MFKHIISARLRKKRRCGNKKDVDCITEGNIRHIIYRRYAEGEIHAVE
jgi:hypothetical protein